MYLLRLAAFLVQLLFGANKERVLRISDLSNSHVKTVDRYFLTRIDWTTSNLGAILFKNKHETQDMLQEKIFTIHIYKYHNDFKSRHLMDHATNRYDPFKDCPAQNCMMAQSKEYLYIADAVVVFLFRGRLPRKYHRNPTQRWIFLSDESPVNTFAGAKDKPSLSRLANLFNWSMTYRSDSDVPIPYGRTVPLENPVFPNKWKLSYGNIASLVPHWHKKRRDVLINVLMSHCRSHRMNYIKYLQQYIDINFYGKCSPTPQFRKRCPGHFHDDCDVTTEFLFYLVLENTSCRQYMTEKIFYNAYLKGAIPVIRHPTLEDCVKLLPPKSFLHVEQFNSPSDMVALIKAMGDNEELLLTYHAWRNHFNVTNEHGFFKSKSFQMCRLCQALNYNDNKVSIYNEDDIRLFLDPKILCNGIGDYEMPPEIKPKQKKRRKQG